MLDFLNKFSFFNKARKILRFFVVKNILEMLKTTQVSIKN